MDLGNISLTSIPDTTGIVTEEIPSTPSPTDSGPLEVELVFPTQAIPLVIAGIPESLLPIWDLRRNHITGASLLTTLKYFYKRQQLVHTSAMII